MKLEIKRKSKGKTRSHNAVKAVIKILVILVMIIALLTAIYFLLDKNTGEEYKVDLGEISERPFVSTN